MSTKRKLIMPTEEEDAEINRGIAADPDTFDPTEENLDRFWSAAKRGRPLGSGNKSKLTVRLDNDIISTFKDSGSGWQTRMNDALKDWLKDHKPSELR